MLLSASIRLTESIPNHLLNGEDPSVVASARAGDSKAFDVLASTYRKRILNIVRRITGNLDDAEDVTQQALMKAFMNVRGFRGTCSFSTWLTRIAINEAIMWRRKAQVRYEFTWPTSSPLEEREHVFEVADDRPNPEQCYDKQQRRLLVGAAIERLAPASRVALEICDLNEQPLKDLALVQGISLSAAKSRLFRSRNLVRAKVTHFFKVRTSERV